MELTPNRTFSSFYIILDSIFLIVIAIYLIRTKRYVPFLVGILGGLLYFVVDYGIFYALLHTRKVFGANPFFFLLWLSMSYGFTNMAWMWLWFSEKENRREWSYLIIIAWFSIALISSGLGNSWKIISIERGTLSYHWVMAVFLIVGYSILLFYNLSVKEQSKKHDIKSILLIGILTQLGWEAVLFITGIRRAGLTTLVVNSLLETNMGSPFIYLIYCAYKKYACKKSCE